MAENQPQVEPVNAGVVDRVMGDLLSQVNEPDFGKKARASSQVRTILKAERTVLFSTLPAPARLTHAVEEHRLASWIDLGLKVLGGSAGVYGAYRVARRAFSWVTNWFSPSV